MEKRYDIPVLYTVFNRLDLVKKTFPPIQKIKPKQLFIGADGPRNKNEKVKTDSVREYILNNIDWDCEVKTKFHPKNIGSHKATLGAVDWFFKNVKEGIVLEDDDLASKDFFKFCQEILKKYKGNKKIMSICGYNPLKTSKLKESYYFSKSFGVWGWASWRDRWEKRKGSEGDYEKDEKSGKFKRMIKNPIERIIFRKRCKNSLVGEITDWTYSFLYLHLANKGMCIKPKNNIVENVGFGKDATNTSNNFIDNKFYSIPISKLKFPLIHPKKIKINKKISKKELNFEVKRIILKKILTFLHIIKYDYNN